MRLAVMVVGAAVLGATGVLLSFTPARAPASVQPIAVPAPAPASVRPVGECPPCKSGPLDADGWLRTGADDLSIRRASALSLAMEAAGGVGAALRSEDPAVRELAALLLNVTSGRVAGCTPIAEGGRVSAVLDKLDRLIAGVQSGAPISAGELAATVAAAAILNAGEGLPPGCRG